MPLNAGSYGIGRNAFGPDWTLGPDLFGGRIVDADLCDANPASHSRNSFIPFSPSCQDVAVKQTAELFASIM